MNLASFVLVILLLTGISHSSQNPPLQKVPRRPVIGRAGDPSGIKTPVVPAPPAPMQLNINLFSMKCRDEDDLTSHDEPYLVNVGFKAKLVRDATGKGKVDPATIQVFAIGTPGHNNLGQTGDDWAIENKRYRITGQNFSTTVLKEPGWIAGIVCAMYEEDMYSDQMAKTFSGRLMGSVRSCLTSLELQNLADLELNFTGIARFVRELQAGILKFFPSIFRAFASTINPDDFGGANVVIAATLPNNQVKMFAGPASAEEKFMNMVDVPRPGGGNNAVNFALDFPANSPFFLGFTKPGKYGGSCTFSGYVTRSN